MITYSLAARQSIEAAGIGYHLPKNSEAKKDFINTRLPLSLQGMRDFLKQEFEKQDGEGLEKLVRAMGDKRVKEIVGLGETVEIDFG